MTATLAVVAETSDPRPDYACAIITDRRGWLLLELRPPSARFAAGLLTCFGGRREAGEDAPTALERELEEELGWTPAVAEPACDLWQGSWFIARFFRCTWNPANTPAVRNHVDVDIDAPFARPFARGAAMSTSPSSSGIPINDPANTPAVRDRVDVDIDAPFALPLARGAAMSTSPSSPQGGASANVAVPVWAPWPSLPGLPLSPWHAAVLRAVQAGRSRVDLPP